MLEIYTCLPYTSFKKLNYIDFDSIEPDGLELNVNAAQQLNLKVFPRGRDIYEFFVDRTSEQPSIVENAGVRIVLDGYDDVYVVDIKESEIENDGTLNLNLKSFIYSLKFFETNWEDRYIGTTMTQALDMFSNQFYFKPALPGDASLRVDLPAGTTDGFKLMNEIINNPGYTSWRQVGVQNISGTEQIVIEYGQIDELDTVGTAKHPDLAQDDDVVVNNPKLKNTGYEYEKVRGRSLLFGQGNDQGTAFFITDPGADVCFDPNFQPVDSGKTDSRGRVIYDIKNMNYTGQIKAFKNLTVSYSGSTVNEEGKEEIKEKELQINIYKEIVKFFKAENRQQIVDFGEITFPRIYLAGDKLKVEYYEETEEADGRKVIYNINEDKVFKTLKYNLAQFAENYD